MFLSGTGLLFPRDDVPVSYTRDGAFHSYTHAATGLDPLEGILRFHRASVEIRF